ncbi:hypothetical protein H4R19_001203 [Coemansia spiralis]|nr:hypothetical protein H4R19_001203 [Coemansia spiralis]
MSEAAPLGAGRMRISALLNPAPPSPGLQWTRPMFHPYQRPHLPLPVIGRTHAYAKHLPLPAIGRTHAYAKHPPLPSIGRIHAYAKHPPLPAIGSTKAYAKHPVTADGRRLAQTNPGIFVPVRPLAGYGVNGRDTARDYITPDDNHQVPTEADNPITYNPIDKIPAPMDYKEYQEDDDEDDDDDDEDGESDGDDDDEYRPAGRPAAAAAAAPGVPTELPALAPPRSSRRSRVAPATARQQVPRAASKPAVTTHVATARATKKKVTQATPSVPATRESTAPKTSSSGTGSGSSGDVLKSEPAANPSESEAPLVNWKLLEVPESIWDEAQQLYDRVRMMRDVQNRQPNRMKHAILGALMFILCRGQGYPRTFAEICVASKASKRDIGSYHTLMMRVLASEFSTVRRARPAEFIGRWSKVLSLPQWVVDAATRIHDRADTMAIVQGKCPISVSATSLWLVVWCYNHRHWLRANGFALPKNTLVSSAAVPNMSGLRTSTPAIPVNQTDVCRTASVVIATLTSVFKLFVPHIPALIDGMLDDHM